MAADTPTGRWTRSWLTTEAPAPCGTPSRAHASESRLAFLSEGEALQILRNAFTGRLDESFTEGPVAVEQRRPRAPFRPRSEAGAGLGRERGSRNGHEIRQFPATFDVDSHGASRHRDGDAAAGVAYVELHRSVATIVIKAGLSVYAGPKAQRAGRAPQHRSEEAAKSGVGGGEGPAVGVKPEAHGAHAFVVAESA